MSQTITILGSTGSIGRQALEVLEACGIRAAALTANGNVEKLEEQARRFRPKLAVLMEKHAAKDLRIRLADTPVRVASGMEGLLEAASLEESDTVLTAVVGMVGLRPTLAAIDAGKRIALANKETLVCAGELVMRRAREAGAEIVPVDSEHSAIFQSLQAGQRQEVRRLILTASGGPFFGRTRQEMEGVTVEQALRHPNWSMGAKITIDSATMMNKGLEFIEAMHLFQMPWEKISILVHRESIIHSLVEYCDHAVIAQLGAADMRLPIQYALTYPRRVPGNTTPLDLAACGELSFARPDLENFPCLALALEAAKAGGAAGAVLNAANETAVGEFLEGKIGFLDIPRLVERAMGEVRAEGNYTLEDVFTLSEAARESVLR